MSAKKENAAFVLREEALKKTLIERGIVTHDKIEQAERQSSVTKESIGQILVSNRFIGQKALVEVLLSIDNSALVDEEFMPQHVPPEVIVRTRAMLHAQTVSDLYLSTMSNQQLVERDLKPYFPLLNFIFLPASSDRIEQYQQRLSVIHDSESSILESLLRTAILGGVSDVHITPKRNSYSVFYRHLGVRRLHHEGSVDEYQILTAKIKDRSRMDLAERRVPQDGGFSIDYNGRLVDLRVASVPCAHGEIIVIRILDPEKAQTGIRNLGISAIDQWLKGMSRNDGLCLVCGPTGSGKTSTLNATVRELDRFEKAIYTAEDPVEYEIPFVGQVGINDAVGLNFSRAVRAFMRADPDVIIVGEIRDPETARNAIKAAETGHLVFGTLHTGSIRGAVQRLRDLEIEPHELKYILRSVLAQKLVRTLCPDCRKQRPSQDGCKRCFGTGYAGRTIVSECHYFPSIESVEGLLKGDTSGWESLINDAVKKANGGITDREEIERVFGAEAEDAWAELAASQAPAGADGKQDEVV